MNTNRAAISIDDNDVDDYDDDEDDDGGDKATNEGQHINSQRHIKP